jgi:hypothetical protein
MQQYYKLFYIAIILILVRVFYILIIYFQPHSTLSVKKTMKKHTNSMCIKQVRIYSTSTNNKMYSPPYSFPINEISKYKNLHGVSGVYMIINNLNPTLFYIGSSINLQRRLTTYLDTIKGHRSGSSSFEKSIHKNSVNKWSIMILAIVPKHLVLVEEQLAICTFNPLLNTNFKVLINYWLPGFNVEEALRLSIEYQNLFPVGSINYLRFDHIIKSFKGLVSLKNIKSHTPNGNIGKPVFVYDFITRNLVSIYGSINIAIKGL